MSIPMSQLDKVDRGSTTEPDTPPPETIQAPHRFVFAHLIPLSQVGRRAILTGEKQRSTYHSKFVTNIDYLGNSSIPCFEIALNELPNYPDKGWFIGIGRPDMPDGGVELQLVTAESDEHNVAGVHARLSWVRDAGGFFLVVSNGRGMSCNVNGEHISVLGEMRPVPFKNTILIGELPFTLQYVQRSFLEESHFQVDLKAFLSRFLKDDNPFVVPTPRELDSRFGEWIVQTPIARGTFGIVYMVVHAANGSQAAAKQLLKTKYNARSIEREVEMAKRISKLCHKGIARPLDIRHLKCQTEAEIGRIRKLLDRDWDPTQQGNITDEYIIISPFLPGTLCAVISSPVVSESARAVFFGKILSAVQFLHANGLIHRDIKPENILVETFDPPVPKLSDWGCVSNNKAILYDKPGTIPYLAPEQVEGEYHGTPVDAWACGLIGYELLFKERIRTRVSPGPHLNSMYDRLHNTEYEVALMPFCCRRLLDPEPEDRFTAEEALNVFIYRGGNAIRDALDERISADTNDNARTSSKRIKLSH